MNKTGRLYSRSFQSLQSSGREKDGAKQSQLVTAETDDDRKKGTQQKSNETASGEQIPAF